ncbi:hypothetical protein R6Q59_027654 [Mikania micrantha]
MNNMKQLHKQSHTNHRRDEEMPNNQTPPYSPKSYKFSSSRRPLNYIFNEQRFLFVLVGIMIGSIIFIFQPSLSAIKPTTTTFHINSHVMPSMPRSMSISHRERPTIHHRPTSRIPGGIIRRRMRTVVTGGAGFVGSHLVDALMARGDEIIVIDNFFTGRKENVAHHLDNPRFELIRHDVVQPILLEVDQIYHLACPASPVHYKYNPIKTIISF